MPSKTPRPTQSELAILRVLWKLQSATVRQVHAAMPAASSVGYTTILKQLQIMSEKGLVTRDESQRSHVYRSAISEESTQRRLVGDLLERAFGGSAANLVMQALSIRRASPEELRQIRKLVGELEDVP